MKALSTPVSFSLPNESCPPTSRPALRQTSRSVSADLLKALSIIAVVLIHGSLLLPPTAYLSGFLLPTCRFCVPVFIFLWAHFAEKSINKNGHELRYLASRIYKLLIPFIIWSTVYFWLTPKVHYSSTLALLSERYSGYGWSGQYYFIVLLQLLALFFIIRRLSQRLVQYPVATTLASLAFYAVLAYSPFFTISLISKISCRPFVYWLPYVVLGVIYQKGFLKLTSTPAVLLALSSPLLIFIEMHFFQPNAEAYFTPSVFICATLLSVTFLNTSLNHVVTSPLAAKAIDVLSRNTLGIFCLNPLVIIGLSYFHFRFYLFNFPGQSLLLLLLYAAVIISTCLGLIFILKRLRLGALVTS
jgi:surface polysaccharide O-acyltransferase-like enzyme